MLSKAEVVCDTKIVWSCVTLNSAGAVSVMEVKDESCSNLQCALDTESKQNWMKLPV